MFKRGEREKGNESRRKKAIKQKPLPLENIGLFANSALLGRVDLIFFLPALETFSSLHFFILSSSPLECLLGRDLTPGTCTRQRGPSLLDSSITIDLCHLPPIASASLGRKLAYRFVVLELHPFTDQVHKAPYKTIRHIPQEHLGAHLAAPQNKKRQGYYYGMRKAPNR